MLPLLRQFVQEHENSALYEGLFKDALPQFPEGNLRGSLSLIHIDGDIYS